MSSSPVLLGDDVIQGERERGNVSRNLAVLATVPGSPSDAAVQRFAHRSRFLSGPLQKRKAPRASRRRARYRTRYKYDSRSSRSPAVISPRSPASRGARASDSGLLPGCPGRGRIAPSGGISPPLISRARLKTVAPDCLEIVTFACIDGSSLGNPYDLDSITALGVSTSRSGVESGIGIVCTIRGSGNGRDRWTEPPPTA